MTTPETVARIARNNAILDRMIEQMVHRAGSEDTSIAIVEFIESFPADEQVAELMMLTLSAVERAAQYSTVVDIWDPERRIDPGKAMRLGRQATSAWVDLARQLKKENENG